MKKSESVYVTLKADLHLNKILESGGEAVVSSSLEFTATEYIYPINRGPGPTVKANVCNGYAFFIYILSID